MNITLRPNKIFGRILVILFISIFILSLAGCAAESGEKIVFGTYYNVKIQGNGANSALKEIDALLVEIENQVSTNIATSDVSKINIAPVGQAITVGVHTAFLFKKSAELYQTTQQAFNAAIFPLVELWKFSPGTFRHIAESIPSAADISQTLEYCAMENFHFDEQQSTITKLHAQAKLDFGGIAKGYAVDKALELCNGKKQAIVNIGGNIAAFGDNKRIGMTHPRDTSTLFGVINLNNAAIATSGDYERYYIFEEQRYNHIIAKDGYPTGINNNDIISASVIGESALICDALSTSVMILGMQWAEVLPQWGYSVIIVTENSYKIIGDLSFESKQTTHQRI